MYIDIAGVNPRWTVPVGKNEILKRKKEDVIAAIMYFFFFFFFSNGENPNEGGRVIPLTLSWDICGGEFSDDLWTHLLNTGYKNVNLGDLSIEPR